MTHHARRHLRPYAHVLETIGWTPMIKLNRVTAGIRTPVYAKAEFFNPGGSVKDRIGLAMIEAAEREGRLKPGGLIVEATSGNTGVGLALAAAVKGYRCVFTMPDKMSQEKSRLLRALGAEVIITPTAVPPDHPDNYIMKGRAIAAAHPNAIFADQHFNPVNPEAHYRTTGPEIWEQTEGKVTHFVCSPGTGGTVTGAGRYLKEQNPGIRVIAGDPVGSIYTEYAKTHRKSEGQPYKVEGIGGDKIPTSLDFEVVDEWIFVTDRDAMLMARRLAREEGLLAGGSTGVNLVAALDVARRLDSPDALVVTILCDTGERYLSKVYSDEWMRENQMLETEPVTAARIIGAKRSGAPELVTVAPSATARQALNLMSTYDVSQLPVVESGDCVGAVTEATLTATALADPRVLEQPVRELMEAPLPVVDAALPLEQITPLLLHDRPAVLVRRDGRLAGIITRHDVLQHVAGIQ
ncbi:MAG TPA: pyridoxal-phosphate dependent enzyme [Gemmatimonadales bacterium]|nr:pyridoxal-phosphate dependent enzyme [Gemmatimonadales bacterium]